MVHDEVWVNCQANAFIFSLKSLSSLCCGSYFILWLETQWQQSRVCSSSNKCVLLSSPQELGPRKNGIWKGAWPPLTQLQWAGHTLIGFALSSHTWLSCSRSEDAILQLKQWPLVSLPQQWSCQRDGGRPHSLVCSLRLAWIIQMRAWEQMLFLFVLSTRM